jgi:hypothetical protein
MKPSVIEKYCPGQLDIFSLLSGAPLEPVMVYENKFKVGDVVKIGETCKNGLANQTAVIIELGSLESPYFIDRCDVQTSDNKSYNLPYSILTILPETTFLKTGNRVKKKQHNLHSYLYGNIDYIKDVPLFKFVVKFDNLEDAIPCKEEDLILVPEFKIGDKVKAKTDDVECEFCFERPFMGIVTNLLYNGICIVPVECKCFECDDLGDHRGEDQRFMFAEEDLINVSAQPWPVPNKVGCYSENEPSTEKFEFKTKQLEANFYILQVAENLWASGNNFSYKSHSCHGGGCGISVASFGMPEFKSRKDTILYHCEKYVDLFTNELKSCDPKQVKATKDAISYFTRLGIETLYPYLIINPTEEPLKYLLNCGLVTGLNTENAPGRIESLNYEFNQYFNWARKLKMKDRLMFQINPKTPAEFNLTYKGRSITVGYWNCLQGLKPKDFDWIESIILELDKEEKVTVI